LLSVENPRYLFVRESAAIMEENYKPFHQRKRDHCRLNHHRNLFEEALGFRVSSEYGGGHGTAEGEQHSSPRWYGPHGAARPTSPLDMIIRSTPHTPWYSNGFIIMMEEEEKKLAGLE
jgi:hypothetical protein